MRRRLALLLLILLAALGAGCHDGVTYVGYGYRGPAYCPPDRPPHHGHGGHGGHGGYGGHGHRGHGGHRRY